jgi:hypothetical protein
MNRRTRFVLIFLQVYIVAMLALILYRFIQIIHNGPPQP